MDTNLFLITAPFCLILLALSLESIRRRQLKEKYALIWIFSTVVMLILSVFNKVIFSTAALIGLHHLTLVVLVAFFFIILICMNFSISLSKLTDNNKQLRKEYILLAKRIERLEASKKAEREEREKQVTRLGA